MSAYIVSKAALIRLTEILALEVGGQGIGVFAIEPGTVRTAMAEHALESPEG
jgi:NAD(P)-dependent dehydrogenase (short-subunit alcohol dehydrogenase family)